MSKICNNLYKYLILILCAILHWHCAVNSQNLTIEESICTQVKKEIFEKVTTFSALLHGVKGIAIVNDNCTAYSPFIVGGSPARPKEFAAMARLGHMGQDRKDKSVQWFCGGSLISNRFVLTAAHCFDSEYGSVNIVRLGELDFSSDIDDADPEDFDVQRVIKHENYNGSFFYYDIGLVELARTVKFNSYKHPACLPINIDPNDIEEYIATGWGSRRFADNESDHLLKVKLQHFSYDRCNKMVKDHKEKLPHGIDPRSQICAGSAKARDTCSGDSGGPLLAYHNDYVCMYYVVGITSVSLGGCGIENIPAVYTNVGAYLNWIRDYVW